MPANTLNLPLPDTFKLPSNVVEKEVEIGKLPVLYLRSDETEARRVRIGRKTHDTIKSLHVCYALLTGKVPSLSLLVRRALAAHLKDTVAVLQEGSEAERRAHVVKLLEGRP